MRIKTLAARILIVIFAPAIFLVLADSILRLTGGFEPVHLLEMTRHNDRDYWKTNPEFAGFVLNRQDTPFPPELFLPVAKKDGQQRIVLLGESAAAGFPGPQFNLARIVQALWNSENPNQPIEVVNLTMVGINSNILRLVAREAMKLEPDALVLYAGHNEAIGPYGPAAVFGRFVPSPWLVQTSLAVRNTRLGRAIERLIGALRSQVEGKRTAKWVGLNEFISSHIDHDDPQLDKMVRQTRDNFESIIQTSLEADCKVLICVPAVNLADWPPMASHPEPQKNALMAYRSGKELLEAEDTEDAGWKKLREAVDLDLLRIRADSRIQQVQRDVAEKYSPEVVQVVDADKWLHDLNDGSLSDRDLFYEHVHLTFEGRVAVAWLIVAGLQALLGDQPLDEMPSWERFPQKFQSMKDALLFTPHIELEMLREINSLLSMRFFATAPEIMPRQSRLRELEATMQDQAESTWNADQFRGLYQSAVGLSPADALIDLTATGVWKAAGEETEALKSAETALQKNPLSWSTRASLATRYAELGEKDKVHDQLAFLEGRSASLPDAAATLGRLYTAVGRTKDAVEALKKSAAANPKSVAAWTNLAMAQEKDGDINGAIASYDLSLKIDPLDAYSLHNSSRLILSKSTGDHEQQLQALYRSAKASDLEPNNKAYRRQLIAVLQALGRTDQAQIEKDRLDAVK